nr:hypothetical protein [Ancylothrix sp. D3o]
MSPKLPLKTLKRHSRRYRRSGGSLLVVSVVVAMVICNWRLMVATGSGVFVMTLVYLLQESEWEIPTAELRQLFTGQNRLIATTVTSGGLAALSSYLALAIWAESSNPVLATGAILQGLGTMAVLVLLVWQLVGTKAGQQEAELNELVMNLTNADPLKRLIAVQQLTRKLKYQAGDQTDRQAVVDCFRLMMSTETEPVVREAILDGLQALDTTKPLLTEGAKPLLIEQPAKGKLIKIQQPVAQTIRNFTES